MATRRLSSRSSLDNLRREARRWLRALRDGDPAARARLDAAHPSPPPAPSLRDVQLALAREYGHPGWAALTEAVAAMRVVSGTARDAAETDRQQSIFERLAADLVTAYDAADPEALGRLSDHFGREVTHEDVRAVAWRRVYALRQRAGRGEEIHLLLNEARELIARDAGFGNWEAFLDAATTGKPAPGRGYRFDPNKSRIAPRRALTDAEWDDLVRVIADQQIEEVDANDRMTDAMLARIAGIPTVKRLRLGGSRALTNDGLHHLARMPQLEELDLGEYPGGVITDRGLEVLRHLPNLRRFAVCWQSGITDLGVAHLEACEQIEAVDLMGTRTGDPALRALAGKTELRRLKTGRQVTDDGLRFLCEIPRFRTWHGGEAPLSLMEPAPGPTQLLLDGPITDGGVAQLSTLDGLFSLGFFWHTKALTSAALGALAKLAHLGMLDWGGERCDDEALRMIGALPHLRMLLAQGTVATDVGFEALARSRTLEVLWGRECPNLTGRGFAALARMPHLRSLGVSLANVGDASLALLQRFPSLTELMPMDVQDDGFHHVGQCAKLETLWCMYCRETGDDATESIRDLHLQSYYAGLTKITDRSLEILSTMSTLERLQFTETAAITDAGVRQLARLPRLRELTLENLPNVTADVIASFGPDVEVSV